jgi:hypothetical protein
MDINGGPQRPDRKPITHLGRSADHAGGQGALRQAPGNAAEKRRHNNTLYEVESIYDYSREADLPKIKAHVMLIKNVIAATQSTGTGRNRNGRFGKPTATSRRSFMGIANGSRRPMGEVRPNVAWCQEKTSSPCLGSGILPIQAADT